MSGDADHQGGKDQRSNNGLDEPQKDDAQHLQAGSDLGPVMANLRAHQDARGNPYGERAAAVGVTAKCQGRNPAHDEQQFRRNWRSGVMCYRPKNGGHSCKQQEGQEKAELPRRMFHQRNQSSSSIELCVLSSRYFTMIGV